MTSSRRLLLRHALLLIAAVALGGAVFVAAGLVPIAASAGHWSITRALLQFAMERSVATHTLGLRAPPLDDPALVAKGAGHYVSGCMPCHGGPGEPRSEIVKRMLPEPPDLTRTVAGLPPEHLFWIVKHGLKYTAMPAWVAPDRDDEVWAMVAFLRRLPTLEPAQFRQLGYGELATASDAAGQMVAAGQAPMPGDCARCHGSDGGGRGNAAFPRLAGQSEAFLRASLQAYASGARHSGIMQPVAAGLDARQIETLAAYYAALDPIAPQHHGGGDTAAIARGARLAARGDGRRRIAACAACHGPGAGERNPEYPRLAGQYRDYLALQLQLFERGERGGGSYAHVMAVAAGSLQPRDIRDLALYYATLPPER